GLFILDTKDQVFSQVSDQNVGHLSAINSQELAIHFSNGDIGIYDFLTDQLDQRDFLKGIIPADLDIQTIKYQNDWLWLGSLGNGLFTVNLKNGTHT
ncbi:MAG: hypothetical protein R6V72_09640, partial [Cyclobacterium sp.]|uniref:hypothetical protein n=1 Tax=Cyclobacterium sp. TaxID=1966343 RepID=UPI003970BB70